MIVSMKISSDKLNIKTFISFEISETKEEIIKVVKSDSINLT